MVRYKPDRSTVKFLLFSFALALLSAAFHLTACLVLPKGVTMDMASQQGFGRFLSYGRLLGMIVLMTALPFAWRLLCKKRLPRISCAGPWLVLGMAIMHSGFYATWGRTSAYPIAALIALCGAPVTHAWLDKPGSLRVYAPGWGWRITLGLLVVYATMASVYGQIIEDAARIHVGAAAVSLIGSTLVIWAAVCLTGLRTLDGLVARVNQISRKSGVQQSSLEQTGRRDACICFIGTVLILVAGWIFWWWACYPGNMSPDSRWQWRAVVGKEPLSDAFGYLYTAFYRLLYAIAPSPAAVTSLQVVGMAVLIAGVFCALYRRGIPRRWLWICAVILGLMPTNGVLLSTVWRDVPYAMALLAALWALLCMLEKPTWRNALALGFSLFCAFHARLNGFVVVALVLVFLAGWSIARRILKPWIAIVSCAALILIVQGPLASALRVEKSAPPKQHLSPVLHMMGGVIHYEDLELSEDEQFLVEYFPREEWRDWFNPFTIDCYVFTDTKIPYIEFRAAVDTAKLYPTFLRWLSKYPHWMTYTRLTNASIAWQVVQPRGEGTYQYNYHLGINTLDFTDTRHPELMRAAKTVLRYTDTVPLVNFFLWRGGVYHIAYLLFAYYLFLKRKARFALMTLLPLGNALGVMLSTPCQDFRYVYPSLVLFLPMLWMTVHAARDTQTLEEESAHG